MTKKSLLRIVIFYLIGISISNVFRFDLLHLNESIEKTSLWLIIFFSPLEAIGLLIGAFMSIYLLRKERNTEISVFGYSIKWSILMSVLPILLLTIIGVDNSRGENAHYYGFIAGIATFVYCFAEEYGWRGYLQDELKSIKEWQRVLIIGTLWYLWHLSFIQNRDILDNLQFLGWMIFGSWGIGKITDLTKSIFVASCFHMIIQIMMFNRLIRNGIDGTEKLIILTVSVIIWIVIIVFWVKKTKRLSAKKIQLNQ